MISKSSIVAFFLITIFTAGYSQSNTPAVEASLENGKALYQLHCLACHQANGSGVPNLNPPLRKTKWVLGDRKELIGILLDGMNEKIEVEGEVFSNVMPPLAYLTDKEIADVLTYVRNSFGNKAEAISETDVKAVRDKKK